MNADEIRRNLEALAQELGSTGEEVPVVIVGGALMAFRNLRESTTDIDTVSNSSFGEVAVWERVSAYQQWIDQNLRAQSSNAPQTIAAVQKSVTEGNSGITYAYFWVQLNGPSLHDHAVLSVDYKTRDGTAKAGQDYIGTQGRLNLYSTEDHAIVAVEILGDYTPEPSENFYLDISNPLGAAFEGGQVVLTAMRTIVNDDGIFA